MAIVGLLGIELPFEVDKAVSFGRETLDLPLDIGVGLEQTVEYKLEVGAKADLLLLEKLRYQA